MDDFEKLILELPAVAELKARKTAERRAEESAKRNGLIDEILETEQAMESLERQIEKAEDEFRRADDDREAARSTLMGLSSELSAKRSTYCNRHQRLTAECGNRAVHDALTRINAWQTHLRSLEQCGKARVAEVNSLGGLFTRKRFPKAAGELAEIERRIEEARQAYGEVEALMLFKAPPEDIAKATEKILARVIDDTYVPFPSEAIKPGYPLPARSA